MKNNQKGITLIALVVTIIVLLILAGVSIAMLSGQNSILVRANQARDESQAGTLDETTKIAVGNILTEELKWPWGTTDESGNITFSDGEIDNAKARIISEITSINANITNITWADSASSGNVYKLTAKVDGREQSVSVDLGTGAVTQ